jgi:hypothetical protein
LHATRDASGAHAVLVATRNALRRFAGGATLEATLNGGGGGGARLASRRRDGSGSGAEVRSIHWSPYDRVGVVNAVS